MGIRSCLGLLVVLLVVLFLTTANADEIDLLMPEPLQRQAVDALRNLAKSPYQMLKTQFEKAREPGEKDFTDGRPGRCYLADRPMQAVAAIIVTDSGSDDGPAFKGHEFRKIIPLTARKSPAGYFDKLSYDKKDLLQKARKRRRADVAFPVRSNASLRSFVPRSMTLQARSYEFRKRGQYILMKATCEDHGGCFNDVGNRQFYVDDEEFAYCYFF